MTEDGKRKITLNRAENHLERIGQIYGGDVSKRLCHETIRDIKVTISGYMSKPDLFSASRLMQAVYVNNRPIEYKYLGYLLARAYEAVAKKGQHPAAFLFITIDPALVDVNVHPAKREVKFFDQKYVDGLILHLAKKALGRGSIPWTRASSAPLSRARGKTCPAHRSGHQTWIPSGGSF